MLIKPFCTYLRSYQYIFISGLMPLWLFIYEKILSVPIYQTTVARENVFQGDGLYALTSGLTLALGAPLTIGVIVQKCVPGKTHIILARLDKAIPPTCALLALIMFTVSAVDFSSSLRLLTWTSVTCCVLIPFGSLMLGAVTAGVFRLRLPELKAISLVAGVRNTLLVKFLIRITYSQADYCLMTVYLQTIDLFTLIVMFVMYATHIILWYVEPSSKGSTYKSAHDHDGLGGLRYSIGEKIVRSMIQAGEIKFGKRLSPVNCQENKIREEPPTSKETLAKNQLISTLCSPDMKDSFEHEASIEIGYESYEKEDDDLANSSLSTDSLSPLATSTIQSNTSEKRT